MTKLPNNVNVRFDFNFNRLLRKTIEDANSLSKLVLKMTNLPNNVKALIDFRKYFRNVSDAKFLA